MTSEILKHQNAIENTLKFMVIQVERMAGHATIVNDSEQLLLNDDLLALVDKYGLRAEIVGNQLRSVLETAEEMPAVVIYDSDGKVAS